MFKNVTSQKLIVYAFDSTTNLPKTGDAANLTAYVSKDYGTVTVLGDTSATEMDSTNAKGYYLFDLTQAETNGDTLLFSAKSSTANIVVIGSPAAVFTYPAGGILSPTVAGRTLDVSAGGEAGLDWANIGSPTTAVALSGTSSLITAGSGTGQLDVTSGVIKANVVQFLATAITETAGQIAAAFKQFFDVASPTGTMKAITNVVTATNLTTNNDKTGYALTAAYDAAKTASQAGDVMKVSSGTGANQIDLTSGVAKVNLAQILGTALTETAGQIAAAFKQFFDIASPTGTMKAITNVVTTTNLTTNNDKTGYSLVAGQLFVKKNTALTNFMFVMTDSTTHAPKTGVTVTAQRSIDGGAFASCANSASELSNGVYIITLAAADLNGTNIMLRFSGSSSDDVLIEIVTQA